jgi:hypothetical protein
MYVDVYVRTMGKFTGTVISTYNDGTYTSLGNIITINGEESGLVEKPKMYVVFEHDGINVKETLKNIDDILMLKNNSEEINFEVGKRYEVIVGGLGIRNILESTPIQ